MYSPEAVDFVPSARAIPSLGTVALVAGPPEQDYYPSSHISYLAVVVVAVEEDENRIEEAVAWASTEQLALGLASVSVMVSAQASRQV